MKEPKMTEKNREQMSRYNLSIVQMTDEDWNIRDSNDRARALNWARALINNNPVARHVVIGWIDAEGNAISLTHTEVYDDVGFFGSGEGTPSFVRYSAHAQHKIDYVVHAR